MTHLHQAVRPGSDDGRTVPGRSVVMPCLAILSAAAAVIHFAAAGPHFQAYWLFGVFMLAAAWLQVLWAIGAIARPSSRPLLRAGVLLNAGVIIVYVITRTAGDVVGPAPRATEPAGFADVLCTVLEAVLAAGCAWLLIARAGRRVGRGWLVAPAITGGATAALVSVALVAGGPELVMNMSGSPRAGAGAGARAGGTAGGAPLRLPTASPAGAITMPGPDPQLGPGMKMASSARCDAAPTAAQQQAAVRLVNSSWQGARKYQSLAVARAAGYQPVTPAGAPVVHYLNKAYYRATVLGGPVLNSAGPQSLVYANTPRGAVLVAAMYIASPGGVTPQPGGCLTQWHVHTNLCLKGGVGVVAEASGRQACPPGSRNLVTPPMMHIWFVPVPGGPTAIDAADSQIVHAAEQVPAPANGTA